MHSKAKNTAASVAAFVGRFKGNKSRQAKKVANGFSALQDLDGGEDDEEIVKDLEGLALGEKEENAVDDKVQEQGAKLQWPGRETANKADVAAGWTQVRPSRQQSQLNTQPLNTSAASNAPVNDKPWLRSNWRNPEAKADKDRFADATSVRSNRTKGTWTPGPRTMAGVLHADQKLGSIVFRWDIREYDSAKIEDSDSRIFYKDGVRHLKKGRYWLIVKSTGKRVWEAPIYTNNNTGLKHVARHTWKEYFSLRPKEVRPEEFTNQSPSNKVLNIDWMKVDEKTMRGRALRLTMIVHFKGIVARSVEQEDVRLVGALCAADNQVALDKAKEFMG